MDQSGGAADGVLVSGSVIGDGRDLPEELSPVFTGPDGAFALSRSKSGQLQLTARRDRAGIASAGPIAVGTREGEPITLVLGRGSYVAGRVRFDDGRPAAGVRVHAMALAMDDGSSMAEATAGEDGRYRVGPLAAGPFTISVDRPGQAYVAGAEPPADQKTLTLAEGADGEGVDLVVAGRGQVISGVVLDPEGRPLELATVLAGVEAAGESGNADFQSLTDQEGRFSLEDLPAGTYRLRTSHPSYPDAQRAGVRSGSRNLRLQVPPESSISGVAVDREGRALTDFTVSALPDSQPGDGSDSGAAPAFDSWSQQSMRVHHPGGRFVFGQLAAASYTLRVSATGGRSSVVHLSLRPGERRAEMRMVVEQERGRTDDDAQLDRRTDGDDPGDPAATSRPPGSR